MSWFPRVGTPRCPGAANDRILLIAGAFGHCPAPITRQPSENPLAGLALPLLVPSSSAAVTVSVTVLGWF